MDKGVKLRLVDAPPDRLDICLRTTHHNAVIPPLRSGVGRIGEAVQGRGFSGRQVKGPEHARDIGRGHGMFRILFHIVSSEQTCDLRPKLVFRRPEHDWGPVVLASNSGANCSAKKKLRVRADTLFPPRARCTAECPGTQLSGEGAESERGEVSQGVGGLGRETPARRRE